MNKTTALAIVLVAIGLGSLAAGLAYTTYTAYTTKSYSNWGWQTQNQQGMMDQWSQQPQTEAGKPVTLTEAEAIAQQYLVSTQNHDLAIKEITEFRDNFYIAFYEKDSGIGAFEMLIWRQAPPSGMMGGGMMGRHVTAGVIMPEPGPNMMWNTKYSPMASGMMGQWPVSSQNQGSTTIIITKEEALHFAQAYLDANMNGARVEDATQFHGYYTVDFTVNGRIAGMLSVNEYDGQVWYHSWHGSFVQEVEFD
jgi:hypothetical protein